MNWEGRGELNSLLGPGGCDGTPDLDESYPSSWILDPSILPNHLSSEPRKKRNKNILYGFRAIISWTVMHLWRFIGFIMAFWFKTFKLVTLAIKEARRLQFSARWDWRTGKPPQMGATTSKHLSDLCVKCQLTQKEKEHCCVRGITLIVS